MGKGVKTASGEVIQLKTSYELGEKNEAFYTGGDVCFTSDGQRVLTACASAVKVLRVDTGRVEKTIEEEEDQVTSLAVSGDGVLVVGWRSLLLRQYSLDDGKCTRAWKGHIGPVVAMDFDPTSTLLASGSTDSTVKVWDCTKNYCTHNFRGSKGVVGVVKFHLDPKHLTLFTSASIDYSIRVWDLSTSSCVHVLSGHVSAVTALAMSLEGNTLLSAGRDKVVHVWNMDTGASEKTVPVFEAVEGMVLLPDSLLEVDGPVKRALQVHNKKKKSDGLLFATAGDKGMVRVWTSAVGVASPYLLSCRPLAPPITSVDRENQASLREEREGGVARVFTDLHLLQQSNTVCGVTHDHNLVTYDLPHFTIGKQLVGFLDEVLDIALVGEEESHVAVATNSEEVKVFDRATGSCQLLSGHLEVVLSLNSSADGRLVATGSKDNTIRLWRMDSKTRMFTCVAMGTGHTHAVGAVALSRLKTRFVVSGSQDCTIKLWKIGKNVTSEEREDITKLNVKYTQPAHDKDINSLDISPNDKLIVSGSQDKTAKLWQASDGQLLGKFKGHRRGVWSVKFSPIDQCVATAAGDGSVKLWAVADFSCVKTFEGHTNSALKVCFLSRGMQLASCGGDGLVKVWTIRSNECVATLDQHTEKVWCVAVGGDGREIVSGGADSLICYWKDVTSHVEEEAELKKEHQILQEQELSNLLHHKDYVKAVGVAISLGQPFRVLTILQELLDEGGVEAGFKDTILSLRDDQIHAVLQYASRWNSNSRHCLVAQSVLSLLLSSVPPERLMELEDIKTLLEGFLPYTERHFHRLSKLQQLSSFVEYTWRCMKLPTLNDATDPSEELRTRELEEPVMADADSTTLVLEKEKEEEEEREEMELQEEKPASIDDHVTTTDDHMTTTDDHVTSSTSDDARPKPSSSRKQRLKTRLLQVRKRGTKSKLSVLTGSRKGRTKLRK